MLFRIKSVWYFVIFILFFCSPILANDVVFNEVLSSNITGVSDENGEPNDWIELYNNGSATVLLDNWGLSDNENNPFKWTFPAVALKPGDFLLVWASDKNRTNPDAELHTNFKVSSGGETLILTSANGVTVDRLELKSLPSDVSCSRSTDGIGDWLFTDQPTPAATNNSTFYKEVLAPVTFSHTPGFYTDNFILQLSHNDPKALIVYTLDGSEPAPERVDSPTLNRQSYIYQHGISIFNRDTLPDVFSVIPTTKYIFNWMLQWNAPKGKSKKASIVRAKAFKNEALSSKITTASYFVNQNADSLYSGVPVLSLVGDYRDLFDPETGIYVPGDSVNELGDQNFLKGWIRQSHLAFFETDRSLAFQDNFEIRIQGNTSQLAPQKSFHVVARAALGEGMIEYPIFHSSRGNVADIQSFKRFILRSWGSAMNNAVYPMFVDAYHQALVEERGLDVQAFRPCILFINGEYWGLHELREANKNSWYFQSHYGIDREDPGYDLIDSSTPHQADEGDTEHWNKMINYALQHDMRLADHYHQIKEWVDVQNLIDYVVHGTFTGKRDWPINNESKWRPRTLNGKWRWTVYDMDWGLSASGGDFDMLPMVLEETQLDIFSLLLPNEEFKANFLSTYADLMNTCFSTKRELELFDQFVEQLTPYMLENVNRWNVGLLWEANQEDALRRIQNRVSFRSENLMKYFNLTPMELSLQVSDPVMGYVKVNSVDINESTPGVFSPVYPWKGNYFQQVPIRLQAIPKPGYKFSYWEGTVTSDTPEIIINDDDDVQLIAHFEPTAQSQTLYYWVFDSKIPNDYPLESLKSTYSLIGTPGRMLYESAFGAQYPFHEMHALWRKASLERRNSPTELNYHQSENHNLQFSKSNMKGLQVKQPFVYNQKESSLILKFSTKNFKDICLCFAAKDEGAARGININYFDQNENSWSNLGISDSAVALAGNYQLYKIDFSQVEIANDNPELSIRIGFYGDKLDVDNGNSVCFNNFSVEGVRILPDDIDDDSISNRVLTAYPIPAIDHIYIESEKLDLNQKNYIIVDLTGRTVLSGTYEDATVPLDIHALKKGIYFIKFEESEVLKIIVE